MRKQFNLLLFSLVAVFMLSSCVSKKKFDQLLSDKDAIDVALATQHEKVKTLEGDLETLRDEKAKLEADFNAERTKLNGDLSQVKNDLSKAQADIAAIEKKIAEKESEYNALKAGIDSAFSPYQTNGLGLMAKGGDLYLNAPIRYRSGSTRYNDEEKRRLENIANTLKNSPNMKIVIEGHTDGVPLKEGAVFKNNMELSYARANRVSRALIKLGVNPDQISTVGRGYKTPVVTGDNTEEARATNRRTEFRVMPDVSKLYELSKGNK